MPLKLTPSWRFNSPGSANRLVLDGLGSLIGRIAAQSNRQTILEHFKSYFANAGGFTSHWSSSTSWSESDLDDYMRRCAENAPLFIEAFYNACIALQTRDPGLVLPDLEMINRILYETNAGYRIKPPDLISTTAHMPISVPEDIPSFDEQAKQLIQQSLKQSQILLSEGRQRQAVQEIVWLLETISTAFQGLTMDNGSIEGKYFNKIIEEIRRYSKGKALDQILGWVIALHGYLSSPTGGGVRHGTSITQSVDISLNEARLYCNLVRSYITFLIDEHARLQER